MVPLVSLIRYNVSSFCLTIAQSGLYEPSGGMLRGSSRLLQDYNLKAYENIIKIISNNDLVWNIDIDKYSTENIIVLINCYNDIKLELEKLGIKSHVILITKIMLGILGNVPAYDQYFSKGFSNISLDLSKSNSFYAFNESSLKLLSEFYLVYKEVIDSKAEKIKIIDFSGKTTKMHYPKAKIIDMIGFKRGEEISK